MRNMRLLRLIPFLLAVLILLTACDSNPVIPAPEDIVQNDTGFEARELYNDHDIVISLTDMTKLEGLVIFDYGIENKGEEAMTVSCDSVGVNGLYLPNSSIYVTIPPGEASEGPSIVIEKEVLSVAKIDEIITVQNVFEIMDASYKTVDITPPINIAISEEAAKSDYGIKPTSNVLFDEGGVKITYQEYVIGNMDDLNAYFLVQNSSGSVFNFTCPYTDVTVDGEERADHFFIWGSCPIPAGSSGLVRFDYLNYKDNHFKTLELVGMPAIENSDDVKHLPLHFTMNGEKLTVTSGELKSPEK